MVWCVFVCMFRIIGTLSPSELGLFQERLRSIDKKIQPGLTKLTWLTKGASNVFIRDCLLQVHKVVRHTLWVLPYWLLRLTAYSLEYVR